LASSEVVIIFRELGFNIVTLSKIIQCTKLPALPACVTFVIAVRVYGVIIYSILPFIVFSIFIFMFGIILVLSETENEKMAEDMR
jgi:hypothetical protein